MRLFVLIAAALYVAPAPAKTFDDQAAAFVAFADATVGQPDAVRLRVFHAEFDPSLPGFYRRTSRGDQAALDAQIAAALRSFPEQRAAFTKAVADFGPAFATAQTHFRRTFPDYTLTMPVYLIQSFGQMDGGTRTVGGKQVMLFGADMIAKLHDETTTGPFLDHELFHTYHARYFPDCPAVWCSLWQEGLAVYVAARMNPGANDRQLELVYPRPIRPEIEGRIPAAMCFLRKRFASAREANYGALFMGRPNKTRFPPRFGYLLGAMLVEKIGADMTLEQLAKLPPDAVKLRLAAALSSYGRC